MNNSNSRKSERQAQPGHLPDESPGIWLPGWFVDQLVTTDDLSPCDLSVLLAICQNTAASGEAVQDQWCRASDAFLSGRTDVPTEVVNDSIKYLHGRGLIEVVPNFSSRGRKMRPKWHDDQQNTPPSDGQIVPYRQQINTKPRLPTPDPFHVECAEGLMEALEWANKLRYPKKDIKRWARDFQKLEDLLNGDDRRMEAVLDWYCNNVGDKSKMGTLGVVWHARHFCNAFGWVEQLMAKDLESRM